MEEKMQKMIEDALKTRDMRAGEIPSIDLYMDQIITLIEEHYAPNKRSPKEKVLTKTMINNYSKEGLIKRIKGKKYTKEHILQMLIVYGLKDTLTISEVKSALTSMYAQSGFGLDALTGCYETAAEVREKNCALLTEWLGNEIDESEIDTNSIEGQFAALLCVVSLARDLQTIAKKMVSENFAEEKR